MDKQARDNHISNNAFGFNFLASTASDNFFNSFNFYKNT